MTPWDTDERLPEDQRPPSVDWYRAITWAVCAGICIGFWIGVIFAVVELTR